MITLIPIKYHNDMFDRMLTDYVAELHEIEKSVPLKENRSKVEWEELKSEPFRDDFWICDGKHIVGFVFIGTKANSLTLDDVYIQEFYIIPAERRKGIGERAVKCLIGKYDKPNFSLYILKNNKTALKFWHYVFDDNDYSSRLNGFSDKDTYFKFYVPEEKIWECTK